MLAMVLERISPRTARPLVAREVPDPVPGQGELLLRVLACAVCRTDLHLVDGELDPRVPLPRIPGHQVVGTIAATGPGCTGFAPGDCIGVAWLGATCGGCPFCQSGRENLCTRASFTGYTANGGYAELMLAHAAYVFSLGAAALADPAAVAPLLCAGMIGYRAYRRARPALNAGGGPLALYGFGSAARLLLAVARADGHAVYVHTRPGDLRKQEQARAAGAAWAGGSDAAPPQRPAAAIILAPAGALVPAALAAVERGATVVCAGIHMSDIPAFPYATLWHERELCSVANLTRADGAAFLARAAELSLTAAAERFPLDEANSALQAVRSGALSGSAVLVPDAMKRFDAMKRSAA